MAHLGHDNNRVEVGTAHHTNVGDAKGASRQLLHAELARCAELLQRASGMGEKLQERTAVSKGARALRDQDCPGPAADVTCLQPVELGGNLKDGLAAHILDVGHEQALRRVHRNANVVLGLFRQVLALCVDMAEDVGAQGVRATRGRAGNEQRGGEAGRKREAPSAVAASSLLPFSSHLFRSG